MTAQPKFKGFTMHKAIDPDSGDNIVHFRLLISAHALCGGNLGSVVIKSAQDWPVTCIKCLVIYEAGE
jgi:hypothetical protein